MTFRGSFKKGKVRFFRGEQNRMFCYSYYLLGQGTQESLSHNKQLGEAVRDIGNDSVVTFSTQPHAAIYATAEFYQSPLSVS